MPLCVADHKSQGILPTEEPRNRVVQVKRFGTVLPRPASSRADALSRSARRRRVRSLAFGYQNHVSIDRRSASSANGPPQTRLPMRAVVCARLARQQQYGERGVGRYRLPIGGQRDVPKQEGIARATTMIGMANLVYKSDALSSCAISAHDRLVLRKPTHSTGYPIAITPSVNAPSAHG